MDTTDQVPSNGLNRREINRILQRHSEIDEQRLTRIHNSLTREQSNLLALLPLLLHINHPSLPGFVNAETPAGIKGFKPNRDELLLAKRYIRNLQKTALMARRPPIVGLYLIGSMGSLGQDNASDLDLWLCHNGQLSAEQLASLEEKTLLIEAHANKIKLPVHFFIMNADDFREGTNVQISNESSGDTQHHLLLEEFYRTALRLAGKPPLWWIVPPEHSQNYTAYCAQLIEKHLIDELDWLDFGGLETVTLSEFFTAAHWQLFKGIGSPFKSLLKLMLFEAYADQYPNIQWLSGDVKKLMHSQDSISIDQLDPYNLLMQRIETHLSGIENEARLALARRAFYFKSGIKLSKSRSDHWRHQKMSELTQQWGWLKSDFLELDSRAEWKLERTLQERNLLVAELTRSYQQLTEFAGQQDTLDRVNTSELALLGRKFYAALERHPGKVDCANPHISKNLSEDEIWLRQDDQKTVWQLYLSHPDTNPTVQKSAQSLVEMLAWLYLNDIINTRTRIDIEQKKQLTVESEQQRIFKVLQKQFGSDYDTSADLENFSVSPQGKLSIAFINIGYDDHNDRAGLTISEHSDPLNFGSKHQSLIHSIEHLSFDSWGELRVHRYQDDEAILSMLCAHLNLFWQTQDPAPIQCHCFNSVHANAITTRLIELTSDINNWFREQGKDARYLLCVADNFYLIHRHRHLFNFTNIGDRSGLFEHLMQTEDSFNPVRIDKKSLPNSPLPLILNLNQAHKIQIFYFIKREGISFFVMDDLGALYQQWLPQAKEHHFLVQQRRFFDTLQTWRSLALMHEQQDKEEEIVFYRLQRQADAWSAETVSAPRTSNKHYVGLTLTTGRHGPWRDGFSLISDNHEFSSVQLGKSLYSEVTKHLLSMRRSNEAYPIYLTGVVAANREAGSPIPIVELLRFKGAIEKRLALAVSES